MVAALNEEQRGAVEHILAARDYALVVGLPGAGKSATLAATVKALVDMGKSVLITSHTHNAVDNILTRLPEVVSMISSASVARMASVRQRLRRTCPAAKGTAPRLPPSSVTWPTAPGWWARLATPQPTIR